jgi:hypothetical protein
LPNRAHASIPCILEIPCAGPELSCFLAIPDEKPLRTLLELLPGNNGKSPIWFLLRRGEKAGRKAMAAVVPIASSRTIAGILTSHGHNRRR